MNGDDVTVHHGDKVVTLEERLASMSTSIRRLQWSLAILIGLTILNLVVGPDRFWQIINDVVTLFQ
jgi:hypothetical protein